MIHDEAWIDLCEVSKSIAESSSQEALHLFYERNPLASVLLQTVAHESSDLKDDSDLVLIHPVLFQFLSESIALIETEEMHHENSGAVPVSVGCLPMDPTILIDAKNDTVLPNWSLSFLQIQNFPEGSCQIYATCIFSESDCIKDDEWKEKCKLAFQGRHIKKGCILLVPFLDSFAIFQISNVLVDDKEILEETSMVYRMDFTCQLHIEVPMANSNGSDADVTQTLSFQDIPGYEDQLEEILAVLDIHQPKAAPSAILLSGPAGVGKSRMVKCIAYHQEQNGDTVCILSIKELIFRALTDNDLLQNYVVPLLHQCSLVILDDLHLLEADDSEESQRDIEYTIVQNTITQIVDQHKEKCKIIGVAQTTSKLPAEITKFGRLEKEFHMLPPTQLQRIKIWEKLLASDLEYKNAKVWPQALASATAGCVASDLARVYHDAWTSSWAATNEDSFSRIEWEHLREAARACIPSQLSELDVSRPKWEESGKYDSWDNFAAYDVVKKHVFRNVVIPWQRFLRHMDESFLAHDTWIDPPPGVLFHGPSGCGKTLAAECLAGSLALPVIQVRAADVLDKWLGGSEALLRSLFARARAASPCILFLDEIDAIANNREEDDTNDLGSRILSTLLNEIDGVSSSIMASRVLVVACTNRFEALDSALLRPGRLQEHFHLGLPTIDDLIEILQLRMKDIPLADDVQVEDIAMKLSAKGATGADVEGFCREVSFAAFRRSDEPDDLVVSRHDINSTIKSIPDR